MKEQKAKKTQARSQETRETIYEAALVLFQKKGFEDATMREIATSAGVALGSAYYYFRTKEEVVLEFYKRTLEKDDQIKAYFKEETGLKERITYVIRLRIKQFTPFRKFLWVLAKNAVVPGSPLSPFSEESAEIRSKAIAIFEEAVADCKPAPAQLAKELPFLLWLYQLGILLFWVLDQGKTMRKTDILLNTTSEMIVWLVKSSGLPIFGGISKRISTLIQELRD